MAANWYCLIGQQQYGPFTSEQIQQLAQQGQLQREHYVRTETDSQWTAAGDLPGLFPAPQTRPNLTPAPAVVSRPKKKHIAPPASPAAASRPPSVAPAGVPQARPVSPPAAPAPVATPISVAPVAAPAGRPLAVTPPAATPIAPATATAMPMAAVPVAAAVAATAAPAAAPSSAVRAAGKPSATARPIPLSAAVPAAAPPASARDDGSVAHKRRDSRQKSRQLAGGLMAALVLLIVIAGVVMSRSPGKKSSERSGTATASADRESAEPDSDPEVDPSPIIQDSTRPDKIADPPQATPVPKPQSAAVPRPNPLPAVGKWLDATRQKGGLRNIVGLGVEKAWLDQADGKPAVLNVEVKITNRSGEEPLEFSSWRSDSQPLSESQATMIDDADTTLPAAPARPAAGRRAARRRIAPGESVTEQLSFVFPERDSKLFRLVLPYAALGQTGYLGFEVPRQMIKEGELDTQEATAARPPEPQPETLTPVKEAVQAKPGEPETIKDLRSEIERGADAMNEAMDGPMKPAADAPLAPAKEPQAEPEKPLAPAKEPQAEPEKIPDIRKLIEEEDRKAETKDETQPGKNEMEGSKTP